MKPMLRLLTELSSQKTISALTGRFAKSKLSKRLIPYFARTYGIDLEEAEKELSQYETLNEFFTRRLKPGRRVIDEESHSIASPVDALIAGMGVINEGKLLQVKGQDYTIEELLNRSPRIENYRNGFYFVLYLSPTDYHRIHSPVNGAIVEKERVSGKVYPVNDFGLRNMRTVLSRNERVITYIQHETGEIAVVKVGAMNVSGIRYVEPAGPHVVKGQELAYFEFGSTVVLLMENGTFEEGGSLSEGEKIRMGQSLGTIVQG